MIWWVSWGDYWTLMYWWKEVRQLLEHYRGGDVTSASALWPHALTGHLSNMATPESVYEILTSAFGVAVLIHTVFEIAVKLHMNENTEYSTYSKNIFCMIVTLEWHYMRYIQILFSQFISTFTVLKKMEDQKRRH